MAQQQAIIQQAITQQSIRTAPWQQSTAAGPPPPSVQTNVLRDQLEQQRVVAMEQIQQSETNLAAQYQSIMQQQQVFTLTDLLTYLLTANSSWLLQVLFS